MNSYERGLVNILIVRNQSNAQAVDAALSLSTHLSAQNYAIKLIDSESLFGLEERSLFAAQNDFHPDLAVVLGGDGTIIRTASFLQHEDAPILGINFGHLGFLTNASEYGVANLVTQALCDELYRSRRSCLDVFVTYEDESESTYFAVNEAAISRGHNGRMLEFDVDISDVHLASIKGDGLIVATATGSTAYSLAAGGPLVSPDFSGMIVQPLAPHTLTARALLTDHNDVVEVAFNRDEDCSAATLFIDGDAAELKGSVKRIRTQVSSDTVTFLYSQPEHFLNYSAEMFF